MREATTQAMPVRIVEEERQSRRGHPAATLWADGDRGRSRRRSLSTMSPRMTGSLVLDPGRHMPDKVSEQRRIEIHTTDERPVPFRKNQPRLRRLAPKPGEKCGPGMYRQPCSL